MEKSKIELLRIHIDDIISELNLPDIDRAVLVYRLLSEIHYFTQETLDEAAFRILKGVLK